MNMIFRPVPAKQFFNSLVGMSPEDRYHSLETEENYIPISRDEVGYLLKSETNPERVIFLAHAEIYAALDGKKATINYGYNSPAQQIIRNVIGDKTWDEITPASQAIALYREQMIQLYDAECEALGKAIPLSEPKLAAKLTAYTASINSKLILEAAQDGRADKVTQVAIFKRPSAKTFARWHDRYHSCGMDVMALLPRHHGPGSKLLSFHPQSIAFARQEACAYLSRSRPTKAHIYRQYLAALAKRNRTELPHLHLQKVSRRKFETMISNFDAFHVAAARRGEKYAVQKFMAIKRSFKIVAPGQRVEMDFVNVDLMSLVVETGIWEILPPEIQERIPRVRIYFGAAIDVATRYILAFKASLTPSGAAAVATLRMVMSDKRHLSSYVGAQTPWIGKLRPKFITHDNGTEFTAKRTQRVLTLARMEANRPPAGQPTFRPFIERLFHTIGLLVAPYFDGRTFHNVVEKGNYDPQAHASLVVDELIKVFIFAICDIYHNKPHEGLGGNTPHNAWVDACKEYDIDYPPGPQEMLHIFGHLTKRTVGPSGVIVMGITYDHPELQATRRKHGEVEVPVKFDEECAAQVSFKTDKGWFVARNTVGLDDDVSFAEWVIARKELRDHYSTANATGLTIMYDAINRLRETGEAATIRANLSPRIPTSADFLKWEKEMFAGWAVTPDITTPTLHGLDTFADPLALAAATRGDLFGKDRMEQPSAEPTQEDDDEEFFAETDAHASNFNHFDEDY
ncbi:integrase catalytic domain-containing protein [Shinella sumterensis]|uniref:Transposase family protein n=1 Tax=Shinella sumterensis TaxID=1967501 RepID=A0AA50CLV8_9HYPH|nr:transposase family protein [Shinella sumterensis]WLR97840.1 transposase family protein [Shinella sumterensis]